jgi:hypothetical protein
MIRKQQILTTPLTSIDKSAGEQGPPNRIAPQSDCPSSFLSSSSSTTTPQIKSENYTPNPTQSVPFDTHRISTDSLNRMNIHSNNPNLNSHADTNGIHMKTEQISPDHDTKIQVNYIDHIHISILIIILFLDNNDHYKKRRNNNNE